MKTKILHTVLFFTIILSFSFQSFSQDKEPYQMKTWELKQYIKNAELTNNNIVALNLYNQLFERKPKNLKIKFKVAYFSYKTRDFQRAKSLFYEIYIQKKYKYQEALYFYADICRTLGEYDEAEEKFNEFIELSNNQTNLNHKYLSLIAIEGLKYNQDSSYNNNIYVHHLNSTINHQHLESSPIIISDSEFIYSSFNIDSLKIVSKYDKNYPNSNFYLAKKTNNIWNGGIKPPNPFFNLPLQSTANGAFSEDKTRFYFTINELNSRGIPTSKLYFSELLNGKWSKPILINNKVNLAFYNSTQPTVGNSFSKNQEVIYFVSDRPGGWGGKDIWFTVYDKIFKTFSKPENAGGYINTVGDEMTPFYDNKNKTMYFSSNGLPGFGGFDVFKTIGEVTNWIPAKNIGLPINSSFDEFYYSKFTQAEKGFFISNRTEALDWGTENCCFDIFQFDNSKPEKLEITGQLEVPLITINNKIDSIINTKQRTKKEQFEKYVNNAIVNLDIKNAKDSTYFTLFSDTTDQNGNFNFTIEKEQDYALTIDAQGYIFSSCEFSTRSIKQDSLKMNCLNIEPEVNQNIVLDNILFEFNSATLTQDSKDYLDSVIVPIMQKYDNIIVEIGAHTDYKGSYDYNMKLSQQRAQSVVDHLISRNIDKSRLVAKGYGETKHLVPERNPDGSDNPEARKLNRRVEFQIIGLTGK